VAADGQQIGIKPLPEALQLAREQDLDLVEVAPMANPPVCRIMDYGKFKYEESQKAKESRRKASNFSIKEMKYRPKIGVGDFDTKTRKISEFLAEGHKVKVTIMFRGREVYHPELGMKILDQVAQVVSPVGKVEASPKLDGRNMTMVLAPDRKAQQAHRSRPEPAAQAAPQAAPTPGEPAAATEPAATAPAASGGEPASAANGAATAANGDNPKPAAVATPAGTTTPADG
jgi:translation initiation factor IF-3